MKEYSLKLQVAGRRALLASQHMPVGTTRPLAKSLYSSSKCPVLGTNMGRKAKAGEAFIIRDRGDFAIEQDEASSLVRGLLKVSVRTVVVNLVPDIVSRQARIANAIEMIVARSLAIE